MVGFTSPSLHTCRLVVPYLGSRPQNSAHRNRPALRGGAWRKTRKRLGAGSTSPHPKAGKETAKMTKLRRCQVFTNLGTVWTRSAGFPMHIALWKDDWKR